MKLDIDENLIIDSHDARDLDYFLGRIIYNFLCKFKEEYLIDDTKTTPSEDISIDDWLKMIDKMIYGFNQNVDTDDRVQPYTITKKTTEVNCQVHTYFSYDVNDDKTLKDVIEYERDGFKKAVEIRDTQLEGRALFAKYFNKLWV